jgi:3,4-dihydroxy 2-butanone 4-phosphate synthase/GTP cyclohydrolase II
MNLADISFDSIESAIEDFKKGKALVVVDDEDRENEGNLIIAGSLITNDVMNFMMKNTTGVISVPMLTEDLDRLEVHPVSIAKEDEKINSFAVSVNASKLKSTGNSAEDLCTTIKVLADRNSKSKDLVQPGSVFPLRAAQGGVLRRAGHTEAAIDFSRLAGLQPAGVLVEIMNEDGTMARLDDLFKVRERFQLKLVSIKDLIAYRLKNESLITKEIGVDMPTAWGDFDLVAYRQTNTQEIHLALVKGTWEKDEPILVRVHS